MDIRNGRIRPMEDVERLPKGEQKFFVPVTRETLDQIPERFRGIALAAIEKRERRAAKRLRDTQRRG